MIVQMAVTSFIFGLLGMLLAVFLDVSSVGQKFDHQICAMCKRGMVRSWIGWSAWVGGWSLVTWIIFPAVFIYAFVALTGATGYFWLLSPPLQRLTRKA